MASKFKKRSPKKGISPVGLFLRFRSYAGCHSFNGEVFQEKEVDLALLNFIALDKKNVLNL